jgi:hypothetical protein
MKYSIEAFSNLRRVNIWINEDPNINYPVIKRISNSYPASGNPLTNIKNLAIEVLIDKRDMSFYGLLGFEYKPIYKDKLVVDINLSRDKGVAYTGNISMQGDEVFLGLPQEYSEAISKVTTDLFSNRAETFPGRMSISVAAHSLVGSSEQVFSKLIKILWTLARNDKKEISADDVIRVVNAE